MARRKPRVAITGAGIGGPIALLGAATASEDATVLSRCLDGVDPNQVAQAVPA